MLLTHKGGRLAAKICDFGLHVVRTSVFAACISGGVCMHDVCALNAFGACMHVCCMPVVHACIYVC